MLDDAAPRRRRRSRRRSWPRVLAILVLLLAAFAVGFAFGKAANDRPEPGVTVTTVRTLEPVPQQTVP
jgi:hypothetical protein